LSKRLLDADFIVNQLFDLRANRNQRFIGSVNSNKPLLLGLLKTAPFTRTRAVAAASASLANPAKAGPSSILRRAFIYRPAEGRRSTTTKRQTPVPIWRT